MAEEEQLAAAATGLNSAVDIESQIKSAMVARVPYFEKQADSLTFEGVRRIIEKDLGMEKHALDVHKRFIKQCLQECLDGSETADASSNPKEIEQNVVTSCKGASAVESPEGLESRKETVEPVPENEDKMEDSPVMGLLTTQKDTKSDTKGTEGNGNKGDITEGTIMNAIKQRAAYFRANSEKVTMAGVRRLLEEDLELEKRALDPHKKFISQQLEKVLESPEVSKSAKPTKDKNVKKLSQTKASKEVSGGSGDDSSGSEEEDEDEDEDEVKPRKKTAAKGKTSTDAVKKRKTPMKEVKAPSKRIKLEKAASNTDGSEDQEEDCEHVSGDESQSSAEKHAKKKEVPTPVYGKRVERLKSVIKACGMGVPPSIYKKVKQAPEDKREARLIKELEEILSKEGLSANPSEKEIKDVKRKKERARELEGIDTSNIVSSSRRRSTSSYIPPPKPKVPVESEGEESEVSEEDDEDEEDDDDNVDDDNNGESQGEDGSGDEEESD